MKLSVAIEIINAVNEIIGLYTQSLSSALNPDNDPITLLADMESVRYKISKIIVSDSESTT